MNPKGRGKKVLSQYASKASHHIRTIFSRKVLEIGEEFYETHAKKDKEMDTDGAIELLCNCDYGIMSTVDNDGQPYGIPLNYVYKDNYIYFHSALTGHKIDNIKDNPKVSFCVVADTNVLSSKFSTEYKSVMVFGIVSEVYGPERSNALLWLIEKYSPAYMEEGKNYIEKHDKVTKVMKIGIEQTSGKQSPAKSSI